ncbi:YegP family protein [Nissabacter sp. SGAir0207]|uniref:DUF1508 domain-containing protein n=1 Tax=Nissabacter sp. SGAir0207 TaxID=2126321 RepID=UPI0010CD54D4|nr:YegP family protein [Nissabacter sp. SGAir0207]QCR37054.1 hypothetical protein C1N62_13640 [Nissabacter sp. SGAir0207]
MNNFQIPYYYIYLGEDGGWHWRLMATNGDLIAISPEGYQTLPICEAKIRIMSKDASLAVSIGDKSYISKTAKSDNQE